MEPLFLNRPVVGNGVDSMERALAHYRKGDFRRALTLYQEVLAQDPRNTDTLYMAAICARSCREHSLALELIARADREVPNEPAILNVLATELLETGDAAGALTVYRRVLTLDPTHVRTLIDLASLLVRQGHATEAIGHLEQARRQAPGTPEIEFNLANTLRVAGRTAEAVACYRQLIQREPGLAPVHINLGALLLMAGRVAEAVPVLRDAIRLAPDHGFAWSNLATGHLLQGAIEDGIAAARKAIALDPANAMPHVVMANAHIVRKQHAEAKASLDTALGLDPGNRDALITLGKLYDAEDEFDQAVASFQRALELEPKDPCTAGSLWFLLQRTCRWSAAAELENTLDRLEFVAGNTPAEPVFVSVSRTADPKRNLDVARAWSAMIEAKMGYRPGPGPAVPPKDRLRIGYLSYDFRDHAVGHLVRGLFSQHDRDGFDILGFSYGPNDNSSYRRHIAATCDSFLDVAGLGDAEAADVIRAEQVDILVELTGHTKSNRLELCALRPAPIQATWLGFPGTTGADFIDYLLTDAVVTPESEAAHYSEALVILPHSYQVNDRWQEIAEQPGGRARHGLPEKAVVFAAMVNSYKIEPVVFECWMRLLKRVPGSVLWLLSKQQSFQTGLRDMAARQGIDPDRLVFADVLAKADHLARLSLADLGLDTRIYTGHTTTSDCLFAGLPVVTMKGSHFASRVSESLLRAIELPQLVAADLGDYEELAAQLVLDPKRLAALKDELAGKRMTTPLFDTARTARALERAYRAMWDKAVAGEAPALIRVADL